MSGVEDRLAFMIFHAAITENRCGELLDCLFKGGAGTVDAQTGKLVLVNGFQVANRGKHDAVTLVVDGPTATVFCDQYHPYRSNVVEALANLMRDVCTGESVATSGTATVENEAGDVSMGTSAVSYGSYMADAVHHYEELRDMNDGEL